MPLTQKQRVSIVRATQMAWDSGYPLLRSRGSSIEDTARSSEKKDFDKKMRVVVCGGRDFTDRNFLTAALDKIHGSTGISEVIEGGAIGADSLAGEWADARHVARTTIHARWEEEGRAAGPIRNGRMLDLKPDLVIAFPGGRGTANCIRQAKDRGIAILEPRHGTTDVVDASIAEF